MNERTDETLLEFAVKYAGKDSVFHYPKWNHVANMCGLGQTSATLLCKRFGVDPDEKVSQKTTASEWYCLRCNQSVDGHDVTYIEYHNGCGGQCV